MWVLIQLRQSKANGSGNDGHCKGDSLHSQIPEGGDPPHKAMLEKQQGQAGESGNKKNMGESLSCGFHGKEWVKQGKQVYDWLV